MGQLISRAASDGVQIILETHSDHLLNGVRLAVKGAVIEAAAVRLHFCQKRTDGKGSEIVSPNVDDGGRISDWPTGFFDEWERVLLELV